MTSPATAGYSLNASANSPLNTAFVGEEQVAALQTNKSQRKNKNNNNGQRPNSGGKPQNSNQNKPNSGQNQGQNQGQKPRKGPRHSTNPPHTCCDLHWVRGDTAWYCQKPLSCPWKDKVVEQP